MVSLRAYSALTKTKTMTTTKQKLLPLTDFLADYHAHPREYDVPLNEDSYDHAVRILSGLPDDIVAPEIILDNDGEIAFEWYHSEGRQIIVSIYPDGSVGYAGFRGLKGKEGFYGRISTAQYLPKNFIQLIKNITQKDNKL